MATVSLGGTLEEKIAAIAAAGFDAIELLDADLLRSGMSPEECASRCADLGLAIELYQPFRRAEGVSSGEFSDVLARFERELDVMDRLGAACILVVSNTDDDADASLDRSAAQLSTLADTAADHNAGVMFEALCWGTHISRVTDAWDVVRGAGRPNLSLVVDTFHLLAGGEDAESLGSIPGSSVGFLQLADAPRLSMDLIQWSRNHRCFPGRGQFELAPTVAQVLSTGYTGTVSLEIFNPAYRELPASTVAQEGADSIHLLMDEVLATVA